ncbi:MAG TPA: DUF308 domain-containing protein [Chloroflexota bacterium]|nr:DUF308 domain-containing protein [Chloroflexota bacterium]
MALEAQEVNSWWVYAAVGVISILFGLAAIFWPVHTVYVLIVLFGAFTIIDGILRLVGMFRAIGAHRPWWPSLLIGILDIAAGLFILAYPGVTAVFLLYVIAFWAILVGITEIFASLATARFLLLVVGIISVVFGFVLLGNPAAGALGLIVVIGVFAIVRGVILLFTAFRAPEMPGQAI